MLTALQRNGTHSDRLLQTFNTTLSFPSCFRFSILWSWKFNQQLCKMKNVKTKTEMYVCGVAEKNGYNHVDIDYVQYITRRSRNWWECFHLLPQLLDGHILLTVLLHHLYKHMWHAIMSHTYMTNHHVNKYASCPDWRRSPHADRRHRK